MYLTLTIPIPKQWKLILATLSATGAIFYFCYSMKTSKVSNKPELRLKQNKKQSQSTGKDLICVETDGFTIDAIDHESSNDQPYLSLDSMRKLLQQLEKSITYIHNEQLKNSGDSEFFANSTKLLTSLQNILAESYVLMENHKQNIITKDIEFAHEMNNSTEIDVELDTASFFSAQESLDLSDLDIMISKSIYIPFYRASLKSLYLDEVPCRKLRTSLFECKSDTEFMAKLICLRAVFDNIFKQIDIFEWVTITGKLTGARLLICLGSPHEEFMLTYDVLTKRAEELKHDTSTDPEKIDLVSELQQHGIPLPNFYDLILDYILIDAFELLSMPPSPVLTVIQNRWLSDNFKKSTLQSAIWTLLMAKRKLLGNNTSGFFANYYNLVGTFIGPLAWAFMGPDIHLNHTCRRIRDTLQAFLKNLFTFHRTCNFNLTTGNEEFPLNFSLQSDDSVSVDADEDDSTIIVLDHNEDSPKVKRSKSNVSFHEAPFSSGMRYQTLQELSRDVYLSFVECSKQINYILSEEAKKAGISYPKGLNEIPFAPELEWVDQQTQFFDAQR